MNKYKLYAVKTWGSAIPQLVLKHSNLQYEVEYMAQDFVRSSDYKAINPMAQVPSLRLPSGEIMTESLAICLYLDGKGKAGLVPPTDAPEYPRFLRWSVFIVSAIYSLASPVDHPDWYVKEKSAQDQLRESALDKVKNRFLLMEQEARSPWFLGEKLSLIDLNLAVMTYWEPRREWFEQHCPKIMACVTRYQATPEFKDVFTANS